MDILQSSPEKNHVLSGILQKQSNSMKIRSIGKSYSYNCAGDD